jgi:hypothetical protein
MYNLKQTFHEKDTVNYDNNNVMELTFNIR